MTKVIVGEDFPLDRIKTLQEAGMEVEIRKDYKPIVEDDEEEKLSSNPADYYFYVSANPCADYGEYFAAFTPVEYFRENKCCYDQHISMHVNVPAPGSEDMESTFSFEGMAREDIRVLLLAHGFVENEEYTKYLQSFE